MSAKQALLTTNYYGLKLWNCYGLKLPKYRNTDCSLKTKLSVSLVLIFGTLSFPVRFNAHTSGNRQTKARISHYTRRVVMLENSGVCKKLTLRQPSSLGSHHDAARSALGPRPHSTANHSYAAVLPIDGTDRQTDIIPLQPRGCII